MIWHQFLAVIFILPSSCELFGKNSLFNDLNKEFQIESFFRSGKALKHALPVNDVLQFRRHENIIGSHNEHKFPTFVHLWPNGRIPVRVNSSFARHVRRNRYLKENINKVVTLLTEKTCIRFEEENDSDNDFIEFTHNRHECFVETIGNSGGRQTINLGNSRCWNKGSILHEIMHKLGFVHEHQRNDRNNYVHVFMDRIGEQQKDQYKRAHELNLHMRFTGQYDYDSVMHYPSHTSGKEVIRCEPNDRHCSWKLGGRHAPSDSDIEKINELYDCAFFPKVMIQEGARIEEMAGNPINITCEATADRGHLTFGWYRDGKQIDNTLLFGANKTTIQIAHAKESATYMCLAETARHQASATVDVVVLAKSTTTSTRQSITTTEKPCGPAFDVVVLMDVSASVSARGFQTVIYFLKKYFGHFQVGQGDDQVRVGFVTVAGSPNASAPLSRFKSNREFNDYLESLSFVGSSSGLDLSYALGYKGSSAKGYFGSANDRPDVPNYVIIFASRPPESMFSSKLESSILKSRHAAKVITISGMQLPAASMKGISSGYRNSSYRFQFSSYNNQTADILVNSVRQIMCM